MPCGGILLAEGGGGSLKKKLSPTKGGCLVCGYGGCHHFIIEWDAFIHARCAVKAMADPESDVAIVISHGHDVVMDFSLEV